MNKKEFEKIQEEYQKTRERFQKIKRGQLVWQAIPRGIDCDYHPAVVKEVHVEETYVDVIDVSEENQEKRYESFLTESELMEFGRISKETIAKEYKEYEDIIKKIIN